MVRRRYYRMLTRMRIRITGPVRWLLLALSLGLLLSLLLLPVNFMVDKGVSWWARLLLAVTALGCIGAALIVEDAAPGSSSARRRRPLRLAAMLVLALQLAFGFLTDAVGLIQPRSAVESRTGLIERAVLRISMATSRIERLLGRISGGVDQVKNDTGDIKAGLGIGEPALILRKIDGLWGEDHCRVVRSFELKDRALMVATQRVPATMRKMSWSFTIETPETASTQPTAAGWKTSSFSATEREGLIPGQSVIFKYLTDGVNERLLWDGQSDDQQAIELRRCATPG
jgi:hypothetical protein